ncbi:MAG: molybdopterin-binding protein, partial [Chloroflexi bacterium]
MLVHDVSHELRKGSVLRPEDLEAVRRASEIHVVELEPGDVHEDVAAKRLAAALAGPGLEARPPVQSQARLIANRRGLVRVRGDLIDAINELGGVSVFTV